MNQTDDVSIDLNIPIFTQLTLINSLFTLFSCAILYYPVFPIFVYVFRKNRDKEKDSNVFPILQHFYRTTIFAYSFVSLIFIALLYTRFHPEWNIDYPTFGLIISKWYDFMIVFLEIHHLIIILLAFQRFILYFELPVKADFSSKAINVILFLLYFVGYLKFAIFEISIVVLNDKTMSLMYRKMLMYESIIIHVLLFASAILYIPISVSIRRKAHLRSILKNKPDRFILYQTIGLAGFKVTSLRMHVYAQFEHDWSQDKVIFYGNAFDLFTTPVMIQMSYLFSNQRNLDIIKNIFKRRNRTVPSRSTGESRTSSTRPEPRGLLVDGVNRVAELAIRSPIV